MNYKYPDLEFPLSNWAPKNWCFWTVVLEKTLESPLDCKEIKPVNPKGNRSWIFIGRTDAETETPILWPPDSRNWLIWIDSDAGKDWSGGEGDDRGWHSWMASPTWWKHIWTSTGSQWWTGNPGILQCMGSQSRTWLTELNWIEILIIYVCIYILIKHFCFKYRENMCFLIFCFF